MKAITIFIVAFFVLFGTLFSQPREKNVTMDEQKKQTETQQQIIVTDTCKTCVTTTTSTVKMPSVYYAPPSLNSNEKHKTALSDNESDNDYTKLRMSNWYPAPNAEAFGTYVHHSSNKLTVSGFDFTGDVRMSNPNKLEPGMNHVSTWGLFVEAGSYKINTMEADQTSSDIKVTQLGGGISFARTRPNSSFNAFTLNVGGIQEIEKGTHGLFQWQQTDIILKVMGWVDLTRTRNLFFSRTNFSFYWSKPVSSHRDALYDGDKVDSPIWDKESAGCELDQTMLMFYLGDNLGLHIGLALGYDHYSANMQDLWTPGVFVELHHKDFKIGQIFFAKKINPSDQNSPEDILRISIDGYQLVRSFTK